MFNYLICYIVNILHYKKKKQIKLIINFDHKYIYERKSIDYNIKIEAKYTTELKSKNICFSENYIFNNILKYIGYNLTYNYFLKKEKNSHYINIDYSTKKMIELEELFFDHTVSIKDDEITLQSEPNLFIYTEQTFVTKNGLIFLNVDDEVNILSMHTSIFAKLALQLTCCSNGRELIQLLAAVHSHKAKHDPDAKAVVLLDHVLDGQSGLQVIRAAREHTARFGLPVVWVLVSSTEDADTADRYKEEGVSWIIQKPLSVAKIRELIDMYGQE
eukprot:Mrub_07815.p1 GENE.Mrub_07815~~Mrub_07815.p1  ORF type:complete len:273 (-),score=70.36 Mrub_07815:68-886(-)